MKPADAPRSRAVFVRNFGSRELVESFLVSSVSAVLVIRIVLYLSGYPRVGGDQLHIAHVLWGGILMLASLIVLFSFLGRPASRLASVIGGLGFGLFIDEIGKFVTQDNDYFYEPAVALIYVVFVAVFLTFHSIHVRREYHGTEYLLNALREMEEVAVHDLDADEKRRALEYLDRSDPSHPLVIALRESLSGVEPLPVAGPSPVGRLRAVVESAYRRVTRLPGFDKVMILLFVGQLVIKLTFGAVAIFLIGLGWDQILDFRLVGRIAERLKDLSGLEVAQFFASALAGVFVFLGVVRIRHSRLAAFRMFERAILVSILLVQVFSFYLEQFAALVELMFNLVVLVLLRTMIQIEGRERTRSF